MTIALFSDIHANLPALDAVFANIEKQQPDATYCLGDLVGYNVWPNEVIHEIRKRGIPTLAGNHDLKVKKGESIAKLNPNNTAYEAIGEPEKDYLLSLPAHINFTFRFGDEDIQLLLVHGSPRSVNEYLFADMDEALLLEMMEEANADILCFGHTHKPYHRVISTKKGGQPTYKHAINIGSVGKPKDGNPQAGYVLLTLHPNMPFSNAEAVEVSFERVDYDMEKAAQAIENSSLPNEWATMLRKAN